MSEKQVYESDIILEEIVTTPYKYGFTTNIETEDFPKGIDIETVRKISEKKDEPEFLLKFRERAFKFWQRMKTPVWAYVNIPTIDYQDIQYYSIPKTKKKLGSLDDADPELLRTFEKLGVSLNEQKLLANVAVDAVFDSVSIGTTFKKQLQKASSNILMEIHANLLLHLGGDIDMRYCMTSCNGFFGCKTVVRSESIATMCQEP